MRCRPRPTCKKELATGFRELSVEISTPACRGNSAIAWAHSQRRALRMVTSTWISIRQRQTVSSWSPSVKVLRPKSWSHSAVRRKRVRPWCHVTPRWSACCIRVTYLSTHRTELRTAWERGSSYRFWMSAFWSVSSPKRQDCRRNGSQATTAHIQEAYSRSAMSCAMPYLQRMLLRLLRYNLDVIYKKGSLMFKCTQKSWRAWAPLMLLSCRPRD